MARHHNHLRSHVAYLAARLMAEDGISDYGTAKRKAARQAGVADLGELPDNQEIEEALRTYQSLYQAEDQPLILRRLRECAVGAMQLLQEFDPHLTGSVLTGTAGAHSDINLQLVAESSKDFDIFLINRGIPYESSTRSSRAGDRAIPVYQLRVDGATVTASLYEHGDRRNLQKYRSDGRPIERARIDEVKALLAGMQSEPPAG